MRDCTLQQDILHFPLAQDPTYVTIFKTLESVINPTITGLALRLGFHDAGTYDPNAKAKGG